MDSSPGQPAALQPAQHGLHGTPHSAQHSTPLRDEGTINPLYRLSGLSPVTPGTLFGLADTPQGGAASSAAAGLSLQPPAAHPGQAESESRSVATGALAQPPPTEPWLPGAPHSQSHSQAHSLSGVGAHGGAGGHWDVASAGSGISGALRQRETGSSEFASDRGTDAHAASVGSFAGGSAQSGAPFAAASASAFSSGLFGAQSGLGATASSGASLFGSASGQAFPASDSVFAFRSAAAQAAESAPAFHLPAGTLSAAAGAPSGSAAPPPMPRSESVASDVAQGAAPAQPGTTNQQAAGAVDAAESSGPAGHTAESSAGESPGPARSEQVTQQTQTSLNLEDTAVSSPAADAQQRSIPGTRDERVSVRPIQLPGVLVAPAPPSAAAGAAAAAVSAAAAASRLVDALDKRLKALPATRAPVQGVHASKQGFSLVRILYQL